MIQYYSDVEDSGDISTDSDLVSASSSFSSLTATTRANPTLSTPTRMNNNTNTNTTPISHQVIGHPRRQHAPFQVPVSPIRWNMAVDERAYEQEEPHEEEEEDGEEDMDVSFSRMMQRMEALKQQANTALSRTGNEILLDEVLRDVGSGSASMNLLDDEEDDEEVEDREKSFCVLNGKDDEEVGVREDLERFVESEPVLQQFSPTTTTPYPDFDQLPSSPPSPTPSQTTSTNSPSSSSIFSTIFSIIFFIINLQTRCYLWCVRKSFTTTLDLSTDFIICFIKFFKSTYSEIHNTIHQIMDSVQNKKSQVINEIHTSSSLKSQLKRSASTQSNISVLSHNNKTFTSGISSPRMDLSPSPLLWKRRGEAFNESRLTLVNE